MMWVLWLLSTIGKDSPITEGLMLAMAYQGYFYMNTGRQSIKSRKSSRHNAETPLHLCTTIEFPFVDDYKTSPLLRNVPLFT